MEAKKQQQGIETNEQVPRAADEERPEPRLQTVTDSASERSEEEQALIDQWLAERQCSGL